MIERLMRKIEDMAQQLRLMRNSLIMLGTVHSVDDAAGTVVIAYPYTDAKGQPALDHPMPWLQRSSEHRPPAAGDHALVLDPSLGNGGALAICGWPSTAKPAAGGGGAIDWIFRARTGSDGDSYASGKRVIRCADTEIGVNPTSYAALATRTDQEISALRADILAIKATLDSHVHLVTVNGSPSTQSGTTAPIAAPAPEPHSPSSVAAQHVKVS